MNKDSRARIRTLWIDVYGFEIVKQSQVAYYVEVCCIFLTTMYDNVAP